MLKDDDSEAMNQKKLYVKIIPNGGYKIICPSSSLFDDASHRLLNTVSCSDNLGSHGRRSFACKTKMHVWNSYFPDMHHACTHDVFSLIP